MSPREAYGIAFKNGPSKDLEDIIATDAQYSFLYALNVLRGPFSIGEKAISRQSAYSRQYAGVVIEGAFPAGEEAIATCATNSFWYALHILKGRFLLGEKAISKNPYYYYDYAIYVIKGPFELAEQNMLTYCNSPDYSFNPELMDYQFRFNRYVCSVHPISELPAYSLAYAIMIGGRFPEGEPAMKSSPRIWQRYQEFIDDARRSI